MQYLIKKGKVTITMSKQKKGGIFIVYCPWLSKPIHWAEIDRVEDDIKLMEDRVILANDFINEIINN